MAGTVTITHVTPGPTIGKIVIDWVADASDGSVPDTALPAFEGRILQLLTNPGATAPTANYDITLVDAEGGDRLAAAGANRHTANTELAGVLFASSSVHPYVSIGDVLTFNLDNNAVNSALGRAVVYYALGA